MSNYLCILTISCENRSYHKNDLRVYEIYVTPFLNKVHIDMFCNLDRLYKKLEILLRLFFRKIIRDNIHSNNIEEINFATINQGQYG